MRFIKYGVLVIFIFNISSLGYAGGAVAKRQGMQKQMMEQQQGQVMSQQQLPVDSAMVEEENVTVEDVVDIADVLSSLEQTSQAWPLIIDKEGKAAIVQAYIDKLEQQGIVLQKPALLYVDIINAMSSQSPEMLNQPFMQILQVVAVLEYDFNNGVDKDVMAMKILGSQEAVLQNKKRLGF